MDVFPTFAAAAGKRLTDAVDGVDLMPFLTGERDGSPHDTLFWLQQLWERPNERRPSAGHPRPAYAFAVRSGSSKAVRQDQPFKGGNESRAWELYDLSRDPAELNDLATEFPEKAEQLAAAFAAWRKSMTPPSALRAASE